MIRETVLFANYTQAKLVLQKIAKKPHRHPARSGIAKGTGTHTRRLLCLLLVRGRFNR
jgi:hypothetical protein